MLDIAILDGVRTPFTRAYGPLADVPAQELGRVAVTALLSRTGLAAEKVDQVVFGNVATPADAANIARVIALQSGIPRDRIAHTVSRNYASGMESIIQAAQLLQHGPVIRAVAQHRDARVVLRRRAQHAGAADIDVFDQLLEARVGRSQHALERVQVHGDEIDGRCTELGKVRVVDTLAREQPAVHARVQRLYTAIHHLGRARVALDALHRDAGVAQGAVASGVLNSEGVLEATEILAKHDENYMPPEVADALDKSGFDHQGVAK